jgi:uncharacterized protein
MAITDDLETYVAPLLPDDPVKWCNERRSPKIIHDALWGTFELAPHEVALIDTGLIQRLRFIHQTGAVHLTYPSARHTRFEHVLGVMYQAGRMCTALRNRGKRTRTGRIDYYGEDSRFTAPVERQAKLTALLHDIGHGPFSHTSEQFFSSYDEVTVLQRDPKFRESGAGEILSCLLVQTQKFRSLISAMNEVYEQALSADTAAKMIIGDMDDDSMYLSEIVHGPLDADKLDYMHRDGLFSGLQMHVDLDRLYASITVLKATVEEDGTPQTMTRLAGSMAGTSPLSQIMFNKMLLFTGIYHHHKVRAVDCMLWAIFELARTRSVDLAGVRLDTIVDYLKLTDDRVLTPDLTDDSDIKNIINDIRARRLWRRALVVSRHTVPREMHDAGVTQGALPFNEVTQLMGNEASKILRRRELARQIWEEAGKPCQAHEVWFDIPKLPSMEEAERMWIEAPGLDTPVKLGQFLPIEEWVDLYGMHRWRAHVFCPAPARAAINAAAIKVLDDEFELKVNPMATGLAHIDRP